MRSSLLVFSLFVACAPQGAVKTALHGVDPQFALDRAQPDYDEAWADFPKAQLPQ